MSIILDTWEFPFREALNSYVIYQISVYLYVFSSEATKTRIVKVGGYDLYRRVTSPNNFDNEFVF